MRRHLLIALWSWALLAASCTVNYDPVAGGGDDFPNSATVGTMGAHFASALGQYGQWDSLFATPKRLPNVLGGADVSSVPGADTAALARRSAGTLTLVDTTWYDSSAIATAGVLYKYHYAVTDLVTTHDTTVILWDLVAQDLFPSNDHINAVRGAVDNRINRVDRYSYEDADGDRIMNYDLGVANRIRMTFISEFADYSTRTVLLAGAGPDRSFLTVNDIKVFESSYTKLSGADTLEYYAFTDADGDSVIIDLADTGSCVVDFRQHLAAPIPFSSLAEHRLSARFVVFPADTAKNYLVRFASDDIFTSGASVHATLFGRFSPDSSFKPGDTVDGTIVARGAAPQSLAADTIVLSVKTGPLPRVFADDSLLSVTRHVVSRSGDERDARISFTCDSPALLGTFPSAGTIEGQIAFSTNAWMHAIGAYDADRITASYDDSAGKVLHVVWLRSGTTVEETDASP